MEAGGEIIRLCPVPIEAKPLLKSLLDEYLAEMAGGGAVEPYGYFDCYWTETEARWPYLIDLEGTWAGFVLVNTWSPSGRGTDFAIAEFYVRPEFRRLGIGRAAAYTIFRTRSGVWELSVEPSNHSARAFWPVSIDAAGGRAVETSEIDGTLIYRFEIATD